ncbi:MAG: peptide chain release factor N(5)-glutamine methyltransferase, partial [Oscillospiraceae bacterium]|nr:peptide chain release factor N(5)-glutamine methyltransferase [Oscillospiraceae bacterium]
MGPGVTTLRGAYLTLRGAFRERGVPAPELAAAEILRAVSGLSRTELTLRGDQPVSEEDTERARRMAERHIHGEPLAYILGEWDFYGLRLTVTPDALIPRPDTETLAELAIETLRRRAAGTHSGTARVLDLCCGGGCVGLAIAAHIPEAEVTLADLSRAALALAGRNAAALSAEV